MDTVSKVLHFHHLALYEPETPANVTHGVHLSCQADASMIVTRCGIGVERSGQHTDPTGGPPTACPDCDDVTACPVCGTRLQSTVAGLIRRGS